MYIQRWTEDTDEDMNLLQKEFDVFIDGRGGSKERGLSELAEMLRT